MCSISVPYFKAIHVVSNPTLSEINNFLSNNYEFIIPLLILIFLVYTIICIFRKKYREKKTSLIIRAIILFVFIPIPMFIAYLSFDLCETPDINYYTDREFIEYVGYPGALYHNAYFHPEGKLDITESDYVFACANEFCEDIIIIENNGKVLISKKDAFGGFFTCEGSENIYVYAITAEQRREIGLTFLEGKDKILPEDCINKNR